MATTARSSFAVALIILALAAVATSLDLSAPVFDKNLIEKINSDPTSTWKAGVNEKFAKMSMAEMKATILNSVPSNSRRHTISLDTAVAANLRKNLPENYDTDKLFPQCAIPIADEGTCGSDWAVTAVQSAGNRFCIAQAKKGVKADSDYSLQYLLSCDGDDFCCEGGYLDRAYDFIEEHGLPTEKCFPYKSHTGQCPTCPTKCDDGSAIQLHNILKPNTTRTFKDAESAMLDIMTYGYAITAIKVYQDFVHYTSGVYSHKFGSELGYHGVQLNGWGVTDDGVKYWIVQNNWGDKFGQKGYVLFKRGTNECEIERQIVAASPIDE